MQCQVPTILTAQQPKMDATRFDECKTFATTEEDLEQDSVDVPVATHGQVPVFQKAQRTVDAPLVQYIDTIIDVPIVKRRQALPIQTVQDVGSSSDSAPLVQQSQMTAEIPSSSSSTRWLTIP